MSRTLLGGHLPAPLSAKGDHYVEEVAFGPCEPIQAHQQQHASGAERHGEPRELRPALEAASRNI